eukprot:2995188-Pleurochrysis_carterae.AAC.3
MIRDYAPYQQSGRRDFLPYVALMSRLGSNRSMHREQQNARCLQLQQLPAGFYSVRTRHSCNRHRVRERLRCLQHQSGAHATLAMQLYPLP